MSEKYAIKNCPACKMFNVFGQDDKPCCYNEMKYCEDCTDCLLKRIVKQAGYCLCPEILELLDIEEVE